MSAPWTAFRKRYPKTSSVLMLGLLVLLGANAWVLARWWRYNEETERLRADMTDIEKARVDVAMADQQNRLRVMMELARRQARGDRDLHLAVVVDSGVMRLERSGAILRSMSVTIGPERIVGAGPAAVRIVAPRGQRTVERLITGRNAWAVPGWVYKDLGLPVPSDTVLQGALGPVGLVLSDGSVIYATPDEGPLADSAYVLPGSVRAERRDLRAIAANVSPGMKVYFYD